MNNGQCSKDAKALVFLALAIFCQAIAQICHILIMIRNYLHSSSNNSWAQVSWANRHSIPKRQMPLSPEFFCLDQTGRLANTCANNLSAQVMQLVLGIPAEVNANAFSCQRTTLTDSFASSCLERKHGQIPALKKTTLILFA